MRYIVFIFLTFFLPSCGYKYYNTQILCVKKGNHKFKPYDFVWNDYDYLVFEWTFSDDCIYTLDGNDQKDWNKLTGVSAHPFTNHNNSFMIAWRWSPNGYWEIAPYLHDQNKVLYPEKDSTIPRLAVFPSQSFTTEMTILSDLKTINVVVVSPLGRIEYQYKFDAKFDKIRYINAWFGGNRKAPHSMCIKQKLIEVK
jgi:hypothetical protein